MRPFPSFCAALYIASWLFSCLTEIPQANAATYTASTPNGGSQTSTDGSSITSSFHSPLIPLAGGPLGSLDEFAAAGQSGLRASAQAHISGSHEGLVSGLMGAGATASGSWNDFVLTGPVGGSIPITLNLQLDGTFATNTILSNNWGYNGSSGIDVTVNGAVAGQNFAGGFNQTKQGYPPPGSISASSSGVFGTAGSLPVNFTSPTFVVPVGTPFDISLQLAVGASTYYSVNASSGPGPWTLDLFALSDFSNTLTFATGRPVFDVPEGYTVNSLSAGIVDNLFVVPEPSTATLLLLGIGVLALSTSAQINRRRRRSLVL